MKLTHFSRLAWPVIGSALVLGFTQVSLFAQEVTHPVAPTSAASSVAKTEAEVRTQAEYWTADRMANALPMPLPAAEPGSVHTLGAIGSKPEPAKMGPGGAPTLRMDVNQEPSTERFPLSQNESLNSEAARPETTPFSYAFPYNNYRTGVNNEYPYSTIGKIFFTIPQGASEKAGDYVCSGSVAINSHTVVTARHCMYDIATGKWYSNWTFYPGWNNGSNAALGGGWKVDFAYTWTSNAPNWYWDIGFLAMHDVTGKGCGGDTGKVIGNYTGWLGYYYGGDFTQRQWNIFGYPQDKPFEGNYLYQDNGATGLVNPLGATGIVEIGNPQTGGTSGGPWIIGFNPNDAANPMNIDNSVAGQNYINGVNSFKWTDPNLPLSINGAEFNSNNFWQLYLNYSKATCR